jgi:hypothetical protein
MQSLRAALAVLVLCGGVSAAAAAESEAVFSLVADEHGMILKTPDGRTVLGYMTKKPADSALTANSVCCLYPVNTPSGERVVDFAPSDHPHHRGVFLAWHATEGRKPADFWGWGEWAPTENRLITNRSVKLVRGDADGAELAVRNDWTVEGEVMIAESTSIAADEQEGAYLIDLDFRLTPTTDVTLKQTAFGGFCVKARKGDEAYYTSPRGKVDLPNPHYLKPETDWPAADWYAYTVKLAGGKTVSVAVLDHPENPPSTWHNLAPIAMVNPCIVAPGPVTIKEGQTLRLRYGLVVQDGPVDPEFLNKVSKEWRAP